MKLILIAVPGSGKSTIIQLVQKKYPTIKKIVYGDLMFKIAKKEFDIKDKDHIRKLPIKEQKKLQEKVAVEIADMTGNAIIDTHASVKTIMGYWSGLPTSVINQLEPDAIVIAEFRPEDIIKRRKKDMQLKKPIVTKASTLRKPRPARDIEQENEIGFHQQINRSFAIASANQINCPLKIIDLKFPEKSEFEHAIIAADEIIRMIKEYNIIIGKTSQSRHL